MSDRPEASRPAFDPATDLPALLQSLPVSIEVVAPDGTILFAKPTVQGAAPEMLGKDVVDFVVPEHRAIVRGAIAEALRSRGLARCEVRGGVAGEPTWWDLLVTPLRRGDDVVAAALVALRIDDRKRTEQELAASQAQLRGLVESLPGLVMTLDLEHRITWMNRYATGFTPETVLGRSALDFVQPAYRDVAREAFERVFRTREPARYETEGPSTSGAGIDWYRVSVGAIVRDGEVTGLVLSTEDVTAERRLDEELRSTVARLEVYAEELERKNRQLAAENAERERTERALRQQQEVVRSLSTPIIQAWEGVLALPIVGALDRARASQILERLLGEIVRTQARFAVLDLTGVDVVDTSTAGHLLQMVRAAGLLGSRCLVSGISPAIAQTLVELGTSPEGLLAFGTLQDALRHALAESGVSTVAAR